MNQTMRTEGKKERGEKDRRERERERESHSWKHRLHMRKRVFGVEELTRVVSLSLSGMRYPGSGDHGQRKKERKETKK